MVQPMGGLICNQWRRAANSVGRPGDRDEREREKLNPELQSIGRPGEQWMCWLSLCWRRVTSSSNIPRPSVLSPCWVRLVRRDPVSVSAPQQLSRAPSSSPSWSPTPSSGQLPLTTPTSVPRSSVPRTSPSTSWPEASTRI